MSSIQKLAENDVDLAILRYYEPKIKALIKSKVIKKLPSYPSHFTIADVLFDQDEAVDAL